MAKVDEPAPSSSSVQQAEELTAAAEARAQLAVSPELVAGSVPEYLRASLSRIRAGQVGILPVVGGLLLVSVLFQSLNSHFLTAGNLVNLLVQAAVFSVLAMGEVYALLLGEIDLSIGFVAGISGVVLAKLLEPRTAEHSAELRLSEQKTLQRHRLVDDEAAGDSPVSL